MKTGAFWSKRLVLQYFSQSNNFSKVDYYTIDFDLLCKTSSYWTREGDDIPNGDIHSLYLYLIDSRPRGHFRMLCLGRDFRTAFLSQRKEYRSSPQVNGTI